jgi:hypothetical protein
MKVIRVTETEFELDNGKKYSHNLVFEDCDVVPDPIPDELKLTPEQLFKLFQSHGFITD